jgi:hypothetical protein
MTTEDFKRGLTTSPIEIDVNYILEIELTERNRGIVYGEKW